LDTNPWGAHATTADHHAVPQVVGDVVMGSKLYADGYVGRARMVVDLDRGYPLGVTFVGRGVSELLHSATIAVAGQVPVDRLRHAVPCFPTISEVWLCLLEAYRDSDR
jgi:pyruvate/2-oxoglutarate dehydrogenase complex dihydrolipoamide dehydrogenase (E3) component